MVAILQRIDYNIKLKEEIILCGGLENMSENEEYTPEFKEEMNEIMTGEHIRIPDNMSLLDYILSLPDDKDNE